MKRTFSVLIVVSFFAMVLSACNNASSANSGTNTISGTDLSDTEQAILDTTSSHSFVFDFDVDDTYDEMAVQIEKYKQGELVDDQANQLSLGISDGKGSIIITSEKTYPESDHSAINLGISSGGSTASTGIPANELNSSKGSIGSFQKNDISIDDEKAEAVLAGIMKSKEGDSSMSIQTNFYEDPSKMEQFDVVYLFKAKLNK